MSETSRILSSFILCSTLVLSSCHSQAKASADLVPAAKLGDLATVQDCLSKKANIDTKWVRCVVAYNVISGVLFHMHYHIFHGERAL